jgi:lipopolysaccharide export system protein LptA
MRRFAIATFLCLFCAPALAKDAHAGAGSGVLPGASAKDPLNIDAGKLDYFDKEQKLVYSGSVIVVNGPSTLKASRLVIYLTGKGEAAATTNDRVKHIDAEGPVTLVSKDQIGTGDRGSYDKAQNKVFLVGNVTLSQGDNVTKGEKLVYDVTSGQAVVDPGPGGRVHSIFTPKDK